MFDLVHFLYIGDSYSSTVGYSLVLDWAFMLGFGCGGQGLIEDLGALLASFNGE